MRAIVPVRLSNGRVRDGWYGSDGSDGMNGAFYVTAPTGASLKIIASDANDPESCGWEHVSVSLHNRCPNWPEMCWVKNLFWEPHETVIQFHVPEADHISIHDYCLHLWRDTRNGHALPPPSLV
jgi:hypothetical protein